MKSRRLLVKLRRAWRRRDMSVSLLGSLTAHALVICLILLWPQLKDTAAPRMAALIVDLVEVEAPASGARGVEATQAPAAPAPAPQAAATPAAPASGAPAAEAP